VSIEEKAGALVMLAEGQRLGMTSAGKSVLRRVAFWSNVEITAFGDAYITVSAR
jgi:hypothetical protein